ncbi:MAG: hypothetical protein J3K34DRAFT_518499, partial [Monoraphidium minutum]
MAHQDAPDASQGQGRHRAITVPHGFPERSAAPRPAAPPPQEPPPPAAAAPAARPKAGRPRYFLMPAAREEDVAQSRQEGAWQLPGGGAAAAARAALNTALAEAGGSPVMLVISGQGLYYGAARMAARFGDGAPPQSCRVEWAAACRLPHGAAGRVWNRLNGARPCHEGAAGTEIFRVPGERLLAMMAAAPASGGPPAAPPAPLQAAPPPAAGGGGGGGGGAAVQAPSKLRYAFLLKAGSFQDVLLSLDHGAWPVPWHRPQELARAFASGEEVLLFVATSAKAESYPAHFLGVARMTTAPGACPAGVPWSTLPAPPGGAAHGSGALGLQWLLQRALPGAAARHIVNCTALRKGQKMALTGCEDGEALNPGAARMLLELLRSSPHSAPWGGNGGGGGGSGGGGGAEAEAWGGDYGAEGPEEGEEEWGGGEDGAEEGGEWGGADDEGEEEGEEEWGGGEHEGIDEADWGFGGWDPPPQQQQQQQERAPPPGAPPRSSYFMLKAEAFEDIELSRTRGAWPRPAAHKGAALDQALRAGRRVVCFISTKKSTREAHPPTTPPLRPVCCLANAARPRVLGHLGFCLMERRRGAGRGTVCRAGGCTQRPGPQARPARRAAARRGAPSPPATRCPHRRPVAAPVKAPPSQHQRAAPPT